MFFWSGKYLDFLDFELEKFLKKNLIILSSIEWNEITINFPPGFKICVACVIP